RLYKEGVLTPENTGWPVDKIGSQEFIEVFTHDIAYGKGFGAICAQGGPRVLEYIASHEEFGPKRGIALTHKRRLYPKAGNFSGYGTHHNLGHLFNMTQYSSALYWGIANRDPMTKHTDLCVYKERFDGLGVELESDLWYEMMRKMMQKWIGTTKPIEPPGYEDAEIVARWLWQMNFEEDCLMMCDGTARQRFWCPYTEDGIGDPEEGAKLYKAVTGHNVTQQELWKKCEVPWTLERAIACREGRRASDDIYNDEFYPDTRDNKGRQIEKEMMKSGMQKFYALIGWNSDGVPTRARLEELGMKDVADDLENRGVL
ncbi:MAG: hypothetical protein GX602_02745, partial [Dehalococcoidales bacterium]|nr:hypothetical protein [Dehalococcoidales bacterium]